MDSKPQPNHQPGPSPLDQAKDRLTIFAAWPLLGLLGTPKPICSSPFREDKKASFSIRADGQVFHDFATGDAGDIVAFVARAKNCSLGDAAREVIRLAAVAPATRRPSASAPRKTLRVPDFSVPTITELTEIQHTRHWPFLAGMEIAVRRGLLHVCTLRDDGTARRAWAITDSARRSVQVRRLDGIPWSWNNAKAWTLGGSVATWPIGAADIGPRPLVAFCEGGPDFLATHGLAWLAGLADAVAVVCLPGACAGIHPDALPHFAGKRVRIFEHADNPGAAAGSRWAAQLRQAGATVDGFTFDPPFKDIADVFAATDAEHVEPPVQIFEGMNPEDSTCR